MRKVTTKACPHCGSARLRLFRSLNYKQCHQCRAELSWYLAPGQKPLVESSRDRRPT